MNRTTALIIAAVAILAGAALYLGSGPSTATLPPEETPAETTQ